MGHSQTRIQLALANFTTSCCNQSKYTNVIDVQALAAVFIEKHLQRVLQRYVLVGLRGAELGLTLVYYF